MFRNRAEEMANTVALGMSDIMGSEEHRSVFHKPDPTIKTASDKKKDKEDDKKDKKKDKKKEKCECEGKCECKNKTKSAADQLDLVIKGMAKISEALDNIGLEKSALFTLKALDSIVSEAMGDMSYDANYAKDKKDDDKEDKDSEKDDKKDDKEEDKDSEKDDKKDKKDEDKKEDKGKKDKKEEDDNDANDPLADVEKRMEQERSGLAPGDVIQSGKPGETIPAPPGSDYSRIPADTNSAEDVRRMTPEQREEALKQAPVQHHGTKSPVNEAPKAEPKPKHKREYKHPWERDSFDIDMDDDGVSRMTPEQRQKAIQQAPVQHHGTKPPVNEAPKAEPKPKYEREYKQPWERESFDIDMDDDGGVSRMTPEQRQKAIQQAPVQHHGTTAPVKEAPKAEPEPKHKREYKQPWERDSFEINMSDDKKKDEPEEVTVEIIDDGEDLRQIMEELGIDEDSQDKIMEDTGVNLGE